MNLDELELELRKLPGICWVAFSDLGDRILAIGRLNARGRGSGAVTESPFCTVADVKSGAGFE